MNRSVRLSFLALAVPAVLPGCQRTPEAASSADPAAVRAEIEARSAPYQNASRVGDFAAIQALHANAARLRAHALPLL